jgi:hypothetical protein
MTTSDAADRCAVEMPMTTIDAYLPEGTVVDLVKIDVEGHEPAVLRGMQQTIARSPAIRLIVEFAPAFLEYAGGVAEFFTAIQGLGVGVCRILADSRLVVVASHGEVPDFGYCLLTHTPKADASLMAAKLGSLPERVRRWGRRYLPRRRGKALVKRMR